MSILTRNKTFEIINNEIKILLCIKEIRLICVANPELIIDIITIWFYL